MMGVNIAFAVGLATVHDKFNMEKGGWRTFVDLPHADVRGAERQLGVADGLRVAGADGLQARSGAAWHWGCRRGRAKEPGQALAEGRAVGQRRACGALCGAQQVVRLKNFTPPASHPPKGFLLRR